MKSLQNKHLFNFIEIQMFVFVNLYLLYYKYKC